MRISEAAAEANVNVQTLRYYERRGLLPEPPRRGAGYREYDADMVRRVRFIKRAQDVGFSLQEIRELLELRAQGGGRGGGGGEVSTATARQIAAAKIRDIDGRVRRLVAMREALSRLVVACGCERPSSECPIIDALDDEPAREGEAGAVRRERTHAAT